MAMDLDEPFDAKATAEKGEAALQRLRDADPALFLSPSADLAAAAREASKNLYASLVPFSPAQPPPLSNLLVGPTFDAEQIWSQIELLSRPLVPHLRRQLRRLEQQPPSQPLPPPASKSAHSEEEKSEEEGEDGEGDELEVLGDVDDEESEEEEQQDTEGSESLSGNELEDKFLKINELEKFLQKGEEEEYGGDARQGKKKETKNWMEEESDEEDEDDADEDKDGKDEEEDEEHLDLDDFDDDEEEEGAGKCLGDIMYNDFFKEGNQQQVKKRGGSKNVQFKDEPHETEVNAKNDDDELGFSTHEKAYLKMCAKIEEMEKASLEPRTWTMQGEVNASSRPKNSALEVDLDFEHNVRPAPVITEEVTASLEEMIKKRVIEGHFDDVEKPSSLPSKAPKEQKELDENKSKKGLGELYEVCTIRI
ncbi:hypothetical protein GUJ93_ZPchr0011g28429 [Zizania palustris]|uniref:Uncharacterized protein n=1 Tax=Zizania palustris TaxID=103762 RepID=A0A8J5WLM6_ZIZPA|nr:hypothetical protein GUJ93_ZPchr0011g28429 [Zizania palustris]